ncbi:hypothetical protein [Terricaulis sp.]|uniref:hypothetical protein n=1 Tax=Terricaulis sp. TaxID=2768686 RepID=UPI0037842981
MATALAPALDERTTGPDIAVSTAGLAEQRARRFAIGDRLKPTDQTMDLPYNEGSDRVAALISFPRFVPINDMAGQTFAAMEEWEGVVTKVDSKAMHADLKRLSAPPGGDREFALRLPLQELSDEDRKNLRDGLIFRWLIGHLREPWGTKKNVSMIYFRKSFARELTKDERAEIDSLFE